MGGPRPLLFFHCGLGTPGWTPLGRTSESCVYKDARDTEARNLQRTLNPPRLCCDPPSVPKGAPRLFIRAERPSNRHGVTEAPTEEAAVHRLWSSNLSTHHRLRAAPPLCSLCRFSVSSRVWLHLPPCSKDPSSPAKKHHSGGRGRRSSPQRKEAGPLGPAGSHVPYRCPLVAASPSFQAG